MGFHHLHSPFLDPNTLTYIYFVMPKAAQSRRQSQPHAVTALGVTQFGLQLMNHSRRGGSINPTAPNPSKVDTELGTATSATAPTAQNADFGAPGHKDKSQHPNKSLLSCWVLISHVWQTAGPWQKVLPSALLGSSAGWLLESQNPGMVWVGKVLKDQLLPAPFHWSRLLQTLPENLAGSSS